MDKKSALILACGFIISAIILGGFFLKSKDEQTIRVVGQSVKTITSDIIKWKITISTNTTLTDQNTGLITLNKEVNKIKKYLISNSIDTKDISVEPTSSYANYGNNGINGYSFNQAIQVTSKDVDKIEKLALDVDAMQKANIFLNNSTIEYFVSDISDVKAQMLALAAENAKLRAIEIAKSSGNKVCNLISARSGVFQIRKPLSTDVSDYGIYDMTTKEKEISVTVTAVFKIK